MTLRAFSALLLAACLTLGGCAGLTRDSSARLAFQEGQSALAAGDYGQAVTSFRQAVTLDPEWPEAHLNLGRAYLGAGEPLKALSPLRTAYRLSPDTVRDQALDLLLDAVVGGAQDQLRQGDPAAALKLFREGLDLASPGGEGYAQVAGAMLDGGRQLLQSGNLQGAADLFTGLLAGQPGQGTRLDALLALAGTYLRMGDYSKAVDAARDAVALNPRLGSPLQLLQRQP